MTKYIESWLSFLRVSNVSSAFLRNQLCTIISSHFYSFCNLFVLHQLTCRTVGFWWDSIQFYKVPVTTTIISSHLRMVKTVQRPHNIRVASIVRCWPRAVSVREQRDCSFNSSMIQFSCLYGTGTGKTLVVKDGDGDWVVVLKAVCKASKMCGFVGGK